MANPLPMNRLEMGCRNASIESISRAEYKQSKVMSEKNKSNSDG